MASADGYGPPVGKMTITLLKAKEEPVDDKDFVQPEGYGKVKMPTSPAPAPPQK